MDVKGARGLGVFGVFGVLRCIGLECCCCCCLPVASHREGPSKYVGSERAWEEASMQE